MLYYLSDFTSSFAPMRVFSYVTFRAFMGAGTAFILSLLFGRRFIAALRDLKARQVVRSGADTAVLGHAKKAGTPTMGGLLIIGTTLVSALLWCHPENPQIWLALATMLAMGAIGFLDDWLKISRGNTAGLSERGKLLLQGLWVLVAFAWIEWIPETRAHATELMVPFLKTPLLPDITIFGALLLMWGVIVGTTNAVNLTDGLDGLAIGCANSAIAAVLVMAYVAGNAVLSAYLLVPSVPGSHELAVFCGCLLGAGLGFLWWNGYPAKVFMGDTGSLALGGTLAMVAILIKQELTLLIVGGVFVAETLSVIIQRTACKRHRRRTGEALPPEKRPFRMTPLHHHFEILAKEHARAEGRSPDAAENSVVIRFWIAGIVCALLGLATLKLR